ncbi:DEAD/DEAH box helicase [Clostridium brassicae]|uniref:ATP-dependent RNA helicase DbpA n=1 Tax=Clostridium brassicae TaxID=2999072 RepID=A0ABT4D7R0_9CLOT|nr:DEAD/DEAH box helicase [Clostridium brassicae]MCY6957291.1 DEAD/DEAH box helicase [Clostridium brassicae]
MNKLNFEDFGLSKEILSVLEKLGYERPSEVQKESIPSVLKGEDIIVKAQTGSGKTAAFGIPVCEKIELEERKPQALILTPTRELALQVKEDISDIGRFKRIRCSAIFGKQPMHLQEMELKQRVHVIVGTPGRTFDHIERGNIELGKIKYLIIDEADKMLNMGFIDQVETIIKKLPSDRITMLYSATMSEEIEILCNKYMINPKKIEVNTEVSNFQNINQVYYQIEDKEKFDLLNKLIYTERPERCIVFCSTKDMVDKVSQNMKRKKYSYIYLHGGMEQKDRLNAMESFKRGEAKFLVATDVAARGIHIEDITHVINYDIPMEKESYVHRIGRTGRAGNKGKAITFVSPYQFRFFNEIEEYVGYKIPEKEIPSREEVEQGKRIFEIEVNKKIKPKKDKRNELNKDITKLHINAGKKKKIRPGDIVGAVTNIEGMSPEDIGIINIQDTFSYVDILNNKGGKVLKALQSSTIKGKKVKVEKAAK